MHAGLWFALMPDFGLIIKIAFLLNPLSSIPVLFLAHKQKLNVRKIAMSASALALLVALVFIFFGPLLFQVYGISIDSFRIAGGLVVLLLGLSMARESKSYTEDKPEALVSLMATPLLTGPATLSFLIITAAEFGAIAVLDSVIVAFLLVGVIFVFIASLIPKINLDYASFISRLLGLFLIGLGVEMMAAGIKALFHLG